MLQKQNNIKDIFIFWFEGFNKLKRMVDLKYNLIGICSLISIDQNKQDKLIIDNMKQILENIYLITEKINQKIKEKETEDENNNDDDYEDLDDDDENKNGGGNNNMDEMVKKIINGENAEEEDDLSYEEEDDDDQPLTNFEKQSPILFVKHTLNAVSQTSPDIYKIIGETLGDKINILNGMFNDEEKRRANNK